MSAHDPTRHAVAVLYFASLRERFGVARERVEVPLGATVADLIAQLVDRGEPWADALASGKAWRVAVDQTMAQLDSPLVADCEVAIFPPVTGG